MPDDGIIAIIERLGKLDGKVDALTGRIEERLNQGSEQGRDHEARLRALEEDRQRGSGRGALLTGVGTFLGSSTVAGVISYLISHHP